MDARPDIVLSRHAIERPARYYDDLRTIVVRTGLLLEQERRHLWHELVHADRRDRACEVDALGEVGVDREAAARAMPLRSLEWAFGVADNWHAAAGMLKLPESWVRWYVCEAMHPAGRELIRRASRRSSEVA